MDAGLAEGCVITIERRVDCQLGLLVTDDLKSGVKHLIGDIRALVDTDEIPPRIDLFFHDSTHRYEHQLWEFETFWPRLSSGGMLVSHDVGMNASFVDFVSSTYVHNDRGVTDVAKTSHGAWGRIGSIGFALKT
jgi:hypothetical protein